jgi:ABC-type nitrate/sulfonate/bicarbonate transport system permease component
MTRYARAVGPDAFRVNRIWPSLLLLVVVILIWQGVASVPSIDNLTLASPVETWHALRVDHHLLLSGRASQPSRSCWGWPSRR